MKTQNGFGIVSLVLTLGFFALLIWFVASRLGIDNVDEGQEAAGQVIDRAQDTVDTANDAQERASQLIGN